MHMPALADDASVSIVICNFNHGRFLADAVASALAQTKACQVIVVDDGSTDDSREVLKHIDPRVQVLLQDNAGQLAASNAGFARSTGDVVMFLDADDLLLPTAAETAVRAFAEGVAKVHFKLQLIDEGGRPMNGSIPGVLAQGDVLEPLQRHGLLYASPPGSGNAYRRVVLQRLMPLPVDRKDRIAADFFLIYGSVAFGSVAACDEVLGSYRVHSQSSVEASSDQALVFGNAAIGNDEAAKVSTRYRRLREWLAARTGGAVILAPQFLDFAVQKTPYAQAVLARPMGAAIVQCRKALRQVLRAIWLQPAYGLKKRLGLSAWAVMLPLTPRRVAFRMARFVCNPASRAA